MKKVAGISFKTPGKMYYFDPGDLKLEKGMHVIVDTAMGDEYGEVIIPLKEVENNKLTNSLKKVLRISTPKEDEIREQFKAKEKDAFQICKEKINEFNMPMKLIEAEYKYDGSKLTFYFSSEKRIDFRELVKALASIFKTRIEMRQIGVRDEVRRLGGNGVCGRELCCCSFLRNFENVSIKMAKEQNLSLNPTKISGNCGRLMCCLQYEHNVYCDKLKSLPKVGAIVKTQDGVGEVASFETLKEVIRVKFNENGEVFFKKYNAKDVVVVKDVENNPESIDSENEEDLKQLEEMEKMDKQDKFSNSEEI